MSVNRDVFLLGSDRSAPLVEIAAYGHAQSRLQQGIQQGNQEAGTDSRKGHADALVADSLVLPHPRGAFDFAISIAVMHHLSTRARRIAGVRQILDLLRPTRSDGSGNGRALIFVWALEQETSRRGWKEGDIQDVMVPWVLQGKRQIGKRGTYGQADTREGGDRGAPPEVYNRYYHLYRRGELEADVVSAGGRVLEAGYEKDNWWCIVAP